MSLFGNINLNDIDFEEPLNVEVDDTPKIQVVEEEGLQNKGEEVESKVKDKNSAETSEEEKEDLINVEEIVLEDTKEVDEETITKETKEETKETEYSLYPYTEYLKQAGVLSSLSDEDLKSFKEASPESQEELLLEFQQKEIINNAEKVFNDWKGNLPDKLQNILDNYVDGVPLETILNNDKLKFDLSSITTDQLEEDESIQKNIIKKGLMEISGYTEEEANEAVDDSTSPYADYSKPAKQLYNKLKAKADKEVELAKKASEKEEVQRQKEAQKKVEEFNKYVDSLKNLAGFDLIGRDKEELKSIMTKPVKDKEGNQISYLAGLRKEDPMGFDLAINWLAYKTKGFKDFSIIEKKATTKATESLAKKIKATDTYTASSNDFKVSNSLLNAMKKIT